MRPRLCLAAAAALALLPVDALADPFSYRPSGELLPGSGDGRHDDVLYAPGMRFPLEEGPAFANSQVYNKGGYAGPPGGQCDSDNYAYPWRDNYCETRSWEMPLCPAGAGHQGQDVRPPTCEAGRHWVVATVDGTITSIGAYSVYLTGEDGTRHEYLHMSDVEVAPGQEVSRGERLGRVSNVFGGTPTTIHLHFNLRQFVSGVGTVYVPPYASLVASYRSLLNPPPEGSLDAADCKAIRGWTRDPDAPDAPAGARLYFDGVPGDPGASAHSVAADAHRDDLCDALGSCEHGFEVAVPLSLLGGEHVVRAYGLDAASGEEAELAGSPMRLACPLDLPAGVRRPARDPASLRSWGFSSFWDIARAPDTAIEALPFGDDLPGSPSLVRLDDGALWLIDGAYRRAVPGAGVAEAWGFDPSAAEPWPAARLDALPLGAELPPRPFLVQGAEPALYLIDTPPDPGAGGAGGAGGSAASPEVDAPGKFTGSVRCECAAARAAGSTGRWPLGLIAVTLGAARRRRRP